MLQETNNNPENEITKNNTTPTEANIREKPIKTTLHTVRFPHVSIGMGELMLENGMRRRECGMKAEQCGSSGKLLLSANRILLTEWSVQR